MWWLVQRGEGGKEQLRGKRHHPLLCCNYDQIVRCLCLEGKRGKRVMQKRNNFCGVYKVTVDGWYTLSSYIICYWILLFLTPILRLEIFDPLETDPILFCWPQNSNILPLFPCIKLSSSSKILTRSILLLK